MIIILIYRLKIYIKSYLQYKYNDNNAPIMFYLQNMIVSLRTTFVILSLICLSKATEPC